MTTSFEEMSSELTSVMSGRVPGRPTADALCAMCVGLFDVDGAAMSMVFDGASSGTFGSSNDDGRRLDEYQFTFGEGPCLDAVSSRTAVLVPDLGAADEHRWPLFRGAVLGDGIRSVFALPITLTSICVGALDLFRAEPGPLDADTLAAARLAAELATLPLLDVMHENTRLTATDDASTHMFQTEITGEMDRVEVYQASGMLSAALKVSPDEAMVRLRAHAMATGQTSSQVARAIIERRLMLEQDDGRGWWGRTGSDGAGRSEDE